MKEQQREREEILKQLAQEEEICETCGDYKEYGAVVCDGCSVYGNKLDFETTLKGLEETTE